ARDHRRRRHLRSAAGGGGGAHRPAGDRRPAFRAPDGRRWPRCDPVDRADAAGRARRVRGPRQPAQRRDPRRADPAGMISRYTRPEMGRLWSDEARMEAWRRVEVAAAEELALLLDTEGPSEAELEAIRKASFSVQEV